MVEKDESKVWGVSVQNWSQFVSMIGVPALALGIVLYAVFWKLGPVVVDGHVQFLQETSKTFSGMQETQKQMVNSIGTLNDGIQSVVEGERPKEDFRDTIHMEHKEAQSTLDVIDRKVDANGTKLDTVIKKIDK